MAINAEEEVMAVTDTQGMPVKNPLLAPIKTNDILSRRQKQQKSAWGAAAMASVNSYKFDRAPGKPKSKRWDHYISFESTSRGGSSLKEAARFLKTPGLISLGGGLPSSLYFPFDSLDFKAPVLGEFSEAETGRTGVNIHSGKHDLAEDKSILDVEIALQYGQSHGAAQLLRWVTEHTELCHRPLYEDWSCTMTAGSTSALEMALRIFCERGDYILSEEFTFATAVETAAPMGVKVAGVKMDEQGLIAESLDEVLSKWDSSRRGGARKPFVLYTVPSGQNPTGATQGTTRRRDIYRVAQKHDLYIFEDEPYYFLQMMPYKGQGSPEPPPPASHEEFLADLIPSLLSMDVDGRVMRMDSFSKVIAPGSRLGWITASEQICERFRMHTDVSTQGPSGFSQLVIFKLLEEHWGHGGYLDWLIYIRKEYTRRRNAILASCERHLPAEIVSWNPPAAGMFHWLKIDYTKHPSCQSKPIAEIEREIYLDNVERGALLMPGSWFYAEKDVKHDSIFFRATYAAAPEDKMDEAIRRFGEAVRHAFGLTSGQSGATFGDMKHEATNGHHPPTNGR